jgi:putative salt-induced outer membrane protein YdiY
VLEATEDGRHTLVLEKDKESVPVALADIKKLTPQKAESDKLELQISANIGLKYETGNTEKETYHIDGRLVARKRQQRLTFGVEYDNEYNNNKQTKNKMLASAKYDYFFRYPWYAYGKTSYEFDEFKDLNLKLDIGPGLGYQFYESELMNLSLEAGPSFVRQDFKSEPRRNYFAGRGAINFDRWFFNKIFQYFLFGEGFANPNDEDDRFVRVRTGLRFPLGWGFRLTTQYNLDWDSNPPDGIDATDQKVLFTMGYEH